MLVATMATTVVVVTAAADTRHGASLLDARMSTRVAGGQLRLGGEDARLAARLNALAEREKITHSTPILDLSGVAAGYAFQLGGRPVGRAGFFPTVGGAMGQADAALSRTPCTDLRNAWVLTSAGSNFDLSGVLAKRGLDLRRDYVTVARFNPGEGREDWRAVGVSLLRPTASVARRLGCPTG
jgi:hypothetical protein